MINSCQVSDSEIRDILAQKAEDYHIVQLADSKCAYVETKNLVEMIDSILLALCTYEGLDYFRASDILSRNQGELKSMYCQEEYVEFALEYIANKSPETAKFSLSPVKV